MSEHHSGAEPREPKLGKITGRDLNEYVGRNIRYIHERKPRRSWWRLLLRR